MTDVKFAEVLPIDVDKTHTPDHVCRFSCQSSTSQTFAADRVSQVFPRLTRVRNYPVTDQNYAYFSHLATWMCFDLPVGRDAQGSLPQCHEDGKRVELLTRVKFWA